MTFLQLSIMLLLAIIIVVFAIIFLLIIFVKLNKKSLYKCAIKENNYNRLPVKIQNIKNKSQKEEESENETIAAIVASILELYNNSGQKYKIGKITINEQK